MAYDAVPRAPSSRNFSQSFPQPSAASTLGSRPKQYGDRNLFRDFLGQKRTPQPTDTIIDVSNADRLGIGESTTTNKQIKSKISNRNDKYFYSENLEYFEGHLEKKFCTYCWFLVGVSE